MVPAVQLVQAAAPAALLVPAAQTRQVAAEVAPVAALYRPAPQGVQEAAPVALHLPGLQAAQVAADVAPATALDEPAAQGRQAVAPAVGPYVPAAQGVGLKDAQKKPRGHNGKVMSRMRLLL